MAVNLKIVMDTQKIYQEHEVPNPADIQYSKTSSSRFLFVLFFLGYFIFAFAGCYELSKFSYKSNADVKVPDNTLYSPKYK